MAENQKQRFAEVVVLVPVDRRLRKPGDEARLETLIDFSSESQTYTYGMTARQRGQYLPGQVVWVPFGNSRQQAVILRLSETAPEGVDVKPLGNPVTTQPALTAEQIDLAKWLSHHYLAPLSECIKLILPPGFGARSQVVVEYVTGAPIHPEDITPGQQALLLHLRHQPMLLADIRKLDRRLVADNVLGALLKQGLVRLRDEVKGGRPKPKKERHVQLAVPSQDIDQHVMRLGRVSKQADIMLWLAEQSDEVVPISAVVDGVGSSSGPVRALETKKLVEITPDGGVRLAIPKSQVPTAVIGLRGSEHYRSVLEALAQADQPQVAVKSLYETANTNAATIKKLADAGLVLIEDVEIWRDPLATRTFSADIPPILTEDQHKAWERISTGLDTLFEPGRTSAEQNPPVFLLHGVTGSGKTEIYLQALSRALQAGRQGIVLVPEISLTPQTVNRFAARFPERVAVVHSKLSDGERFDTWRRAKLGEIDVVIGSRSALFTPFPDIGVIVVDEEHDSAYKQIRTPRYHARDAAIELARLSGAITLLGSATPSLESSFQARQGRFILLSLPRRVRGHWTAESSAKEMVADPEMLELPPVKVVDMRAELRAGNRSMFSRTLAQALRGVLARGEQAILFLNRRGSASFVLCRDCGHVMHCPRCSVPLTHHRGRLLICHHCNHREPMPSVCPKCGSSRFKEFGAGTQRLIDALAAEFPEARPLRWDRDTTGGKTSHEDILQDFIDHHADVLVGTQMIAKGLDLPLVTLVGVLSADVGLFLPDFRAAERVFQVLTQVAGRAGRSALGGQVIFQSYHPQHYAIIAASHHDYATFYKKEMAFRQEHAYPPYRRLTRLLFTDSNRDRCQEETARIAVRLKGRAKQLGLDGFDLIGPAPAYFSRERGKFRWHMLFRSEDPARLLSGVPLTPNWRIDVDPADTL